MRRRNCSRLLLPLLRSPILVKSTMTGATTKTLKNITSGRAPSGQSFSSRTDHFHMAPSYTHLGRVAYDAGDYLKAEAMFQRALALSEKALGPDHKSLTGYLNDLAMVYCTTESYVKGESLYRRAISINESNDAMAQLKAQETLFGLARCFAAEGRAAEAIKFQLQASEAEEHYIGLNLAVGSEREKMAVLTSL